MTLFLMFIKTKLIGKIMLSHRQIQILLYYWTVTNDLRTDNAVCVKWPEVLLNNAICVKWLEVLLDNAFCVILPGFRT